MGAGNMRNPPADGPGHSPPVTGDAGGPGLEDGG